MVAPEGGVEAGAQLDGALALALGGAGAAQVDGVQVGADGLGAKGQAVEEREPNEGAGVGAGLVAVVGVGVGGVHAQDRPLGIDEGEHAPALHAHRPHERHRPPVEVGLAEQVGLARGLDGREGRAVDEAARLAGRAGAHARAGGDAGAVDDERGVGVEGLPGEVRVEGERAGQRAGRAQAAVGAPERARDGEAHRPGHRKRGERQVGVEARVEGVGGGGLHGLGDGARRAGERDGVVGVAAGEAVARVGADVHAALREAVLGLAEHVARAPCAEQRPGGPAVHAQALRGGLVGVLHVQAEGGAGVLPQRHRFARRAEGARTGVERRARPRGGAQPRLGAEGEREEGLVAGDAALRDPRRERRHPQASARATARSARGARGARAEGPPRLHGQPQVVAPVVGTPSALRAEASEAVGEGALLGAHAPRPGANAHEGMHVAPHARPVTFEARLHLSGGRVRGGLHLGPGRGRALRTRRHRRQQQGRGNPEGNRDAKSGAAHQPGGHVNARPPRTWRCRWSTVCPPSRPTLNTVR